MNERNGKQIFAENRRRNMYVLNFIKSTKGHICPKSISEDSWFWHIKLGRVSLRQIEKLSKHELVTGLPKFYYKKTHTYDGFQLGK